MAYCYCIELLKAIFLKELIEVVYQETVEVDGLMIS